MKQQIVSKFTIYIIQMKYMTNFLCVCSALRAHQLQLQNVILNVENDADHTEKREIFKIKCTIRLTLYKYSV